MQKNDFDIDFMHKKTLKIMQKHKKATFRFCSAFHPAHLAEFPLAAGNFAKKNRPQITCSRLLGL